MKLPGCRVFIFGLAIVAFLAWPVQADAIQAVKTHVFFEKDGLPYHESVTYTFTCSGTMRDRPDSGNLSEIYHYSATCSGYGCGVWQPDTHDWKYNFDHCELKGETLGRNFTIHNISPFSSCTEFPEPLFCPNSSDPKLWRTEYYYFTPESQACNDLKRGSLTRISKRSFETCDPNHEPGCLELFTCIPPVKSLSRSETPVKGTVPYTNGTHYIRYLETCDPVSDENCPGWVVDGSPLKKKIACRINATVLQQESDPCRTFGIKVNPALILPEEEFRKDIYGVNLVLDICDARWTIPSDNQTPTESGSLTRNTYTPDNPVESLYCSILQFLGGRCG
jgi:hypothetical protein